MEICLKNVLPVPLQNSVSASSEVWSSDLVFKKSCIIHICAPSGSGKSTLIGLVYGVRKDYSGQLLFDNDDVANYSYDDWAARRKNNLAVIFQDLELLSDLSVFQNIEIKNQLTNRFNKNQIHQFAKDLGIAHLLDKKVALLSRGERQRVAIIRSLCMPFEWLLMDEPFSALDEVNTQKAINLIQRVVAENNAGILLVNLHADNYFPYSRKFQMV